MSTSSSKKETSKTEAGQTPRHVAIIMDGNGRWANQRGFPRIEGHRAGIQSVRESVTACRELGVSHLTLYAFSEENWNRPKSEIRALMLLLDQFLKKEIREMKENGISFGVIGDIDKLPSPVQKSINRAIKETAGGEEMRLTLALSYGGRNEIVHAARSLAQKAAGGVLNPEDITKEMFAGELFTGQMPDPDLLIRTSGELRVSNFLLWQIAYTELWITPVLWPDFRREHLEQAFEDYSRRERRFGRTHAPKSGKKPERGTKSRSKN
jgi:undecaprenyl diphosphate synthase